MACWISRGNRRLEAYCAPGPATDAELHETLFPDTYHLKLPRYHESIEEAWKIVEELRRRRIELSVKSVEDLDSTKNCCDELIKLHNEGMKYCVQAWDKYEQRYGAAIYGRTGPEAICGMAIHLIEMNKVTK